MTTYTAIVSGLMVVGITAAFVLWAMTWLGFVKTAKPQRGFEVKLNAGQMPAIREKDETTHG